MTDREAHPQGMMEKQYQQSTQDLAEAAQNPIAAMISLLWSVAGPSDRPNVSQLLQPRARYAASRKRRPRIFAAVRMQQRDATAVLT